MNTTLDELFRAIHSFTKRLKYLSPAIILVWNAAAKWSVLSVILIILQGLIPAAMVYLTRLLIDDLNGLLTDGPNAISRLMWLHGILFIMAMIATGVLAKVSAVVQMIHGELFKDKLKQMIHSKAANLNLRFFDNIKYFDMLQLADSQASVRPLQLLQIGAGLFQACITLTAMVIILLPVGVWLPVILLAAAIPISILRLKFSHIRHQLHIKRSPQYRHIQYTDNLLTQRHSATEIRLLGLSDWLIKSYQKLRFQLRNEKISLEFRLIKWEILSVMMSVILTVVILAWIALKTIENGQSLGVFAMFAAALYKTQQILNKQLDSLNRLYENLLFLENLFAFFELEADFQEPLVHKSIRDEKRVNFNNNISFHGVSFQYPESEAPVFGKFSIRIKKGDYIALVGDNGAGKSTLIKLLTRLYEPDSGHISIDGADISQLPLDQLRRLFTVMLQSPLQFRQTIAESIALGELTNNPDIDKIHEAAKLTGIDQKINALKEGYDTKLGKEIGGTELSLGEWQNLALTRSLYRQADVIILDEPTSSMDSWAETKWLNQFDKIARDKTVILISHRFTTAMRADVIHVMKKGEIIESGSHQSLLDIDGYYARSWKDQMREL